MKRKNILLALGWYHPKLHHGIAHYADAHDWHLNAEMAFSHSSLPKAWKGDGIIAGFQHVRAIERIFPQIGPRLVVMAHPQQHTGTYHSVSDDHEEIAKAAAEYYLEKGFHSFACFCNSASSVSPRIDHFRDILARKRFPCAILIGKHSDWSRRQPLLIRQLRELPHGTAVFCQDDDTAAEVIEACMDGEIPVPEHVSVLGVRNDTLICAHLHPPLSSVENNLFGVGYHAASLLGAILNGERSRPRHHSIAPQGVVERASTALLPAELAHPEFQKAMNLIRQNFRDANFDCAALAAQGGVSLRKLYQIFARCHQSSPAQEILTHRIGHAKHLLHSTSDPMETFLFTCGFGNPRSFYKAFRRIEGMSPTEFRKQTKSNQTLP